jgi:hypothetical protein
VSNEIPPHAGRCGTWVSADDGEAWFAAASVEAGHWNGWDKPWFLEPEAARIAAMTALRAQADRDAEVICYHPDAPPASRFAIRSPDGDEYPAETAAYPDAAGELMYGIGTGAWTGLTADRVHPAAPPAARPGTVPPAASGLPQEPPAGVPRPGPRRSAGAHERPHAAAASRRLSGWSPRRR